MTNKSSMDMPAIIVDGLAFLTLPAPIRATRLLLGGKYELIALGGSGHRTAHVEHRRIDVAQALASLISQ